MLRIFQNIWKISVIVIFTFILLMSLLEIPSFAADLIHGRSVYEVNCAICHGEFGKGDGPRAEKLEPKPLNFTHPDGMKEITPEKFERSVVQGLPSMAEHTFGHLLTPEEIKDVTHYVRSLLR